MKNEEENKDKKEEIAKTKIAMLFLIEERMRKLIEKMIKESSISIEKRLDSAYEKTAKKLKRGN